MKIKDILQLSMTQTMATIAKERLTIGEKPLRSALKAVGCEHQNGKKGWQYNGDDPKVLEQSIYSFVQTKAKAANQPTNERNNESMNEQTKELSNQRTSLPTIEPINQPSNEPTNEQTHIVRKRASFDLDVNLLKELKIFAIRADKNVYEVVEQAIREHLSHEK